MSEVTANGLITLLLSRGQHSFTVEEAKELTGIALPNIQRSLSRMVKNKKIFGPSRGLYVIIPPEFHDWKVVPADYFIDAFMHHLSRRYYVGYLSAAKFYGAAHQKLQVFQVVVNKQLQPFSHERVRCEFYYRRNINDLPTVKKNVPTGVIAVASRELVAFDSANRPIHAAGIDNVATVLIELFEDVIEEQKLINLVAHFPISAARRVGWILEEFTNHKLELLQSYCSVKYARCSYLDPTSEHRGNLSSRWNLVINQEVEPDT